MSKGASERHEFALFYAELTEMTPPAPLVCTDAALVHRLRHVLRIVQGDTLIFFNEQGGAHVTCTDARDKKKLFFMVDEFFKPQPIQPSLCMLLPLLKREAFYDALYSCVELAASHIYPVITDKTHSWLGKHELHKIQLVMQAAAEQSKQFCLPQVYEPIELRTYLEKHTGALSYENTKRFVADAAGSSCVKVIQQEITNKNTMSICAIGPEGDFTQREKELLAQAGFIPCSLSPTVLRSSQAVAVMLGIIRSQWS